MRFNIAVTAVVLALIFGGCVSVTPVSDAQAEQERVSAPDPDRGAVFVMRRKGFTGKGVGPHVAIDGVQQGRIGTGNCFRFDLFPGNVTVSVELGGGYDGVSFDLGAGQKVYLWVDLDTSGFSSYQPKISIMAPASGQSRISEMRMISPRGTIPPKKADPENALVRDLRVLKQLLDEGLITPAEFEARKADRLAKAAEQDARPNALISVPRSP